MPIKKAALKRVRADKKRHQYNASIANELKTRVKRVRELIADKKSEEARALLPAISSRLHKAVQRNIIHKNKASRSISRLEKAIKTISKS
ncbi:MAG: 30S ribosomal protein S20 [Candidatus Omnitrophota bacterium]